MSTQVAVIVPWRDTDQHRADAWAHLRQRWATAHPDWPVIEGRAPDGPWVKALAVADGLARTDAAIIVLADADVWCDGVALAVDAVTTGAGWAIPHWHVHRLTQAATDAVLAGGPFGGPLARKPYRGFAGGGLTVIRRELLDAAPLDPRFVGWGQEDQAAALAWRTLGGDPWRGRADLWHLWHPPQPRWSIQWGSPDSHALWRRYRAANGRHDRMTALITQARTGPPPVPAVTTREDPMGTTNTWRNRIDGRTTTTVAGTQRDRIFGRHGDWSLVGPVPPPAPVTDPAPVPVAEVTSHLVVDHDPAETEGETPATSDSAEAEPEPAGTDQADEGGDMLRHTGAGWYEIVIGGEVRDRVRGKEAAEARAAELLGGEA